MEPHLVQPLEPNESPKFNVRKLILGALLIVILGTFSGYLLAQISTSSIAGTTVSSKDMIQTVNEVGSKDTKVYRDSATGKLESGGISGEGTHHLVLDSNPKNSAYLVSSVIDLNEFVGKHVEVRGETLKAIKAPWLMDVGYVKILE